jgi:hypothetical protein
MPAAAANPDNTGNKIAREMTEMQLRVAQEIVQSFGPGSQELLPAVLMALALNTHARMTKG